VSSCSRIRVSTNAVSVSPDPNTLPILRRTAREYCFVKEYSQELLLKIIHKSTVVHDKERINTKFDL
jgi:hypothetical protein